MVRHLRWVDSGCHLLRGTQKLMVAQKWANWRVWGLNTIPFHWRESGEFFLSLGRRRGGENGEQSSHSFQICKELSFPKEMCFIGPRNSELRPVNGNARKVQYKEEAPNGVTQSGHLLYHLALSWRGGRARRIGGQEYCRGHFCARWPLTSSYSLPHTPIGFSLTFSPFTALLRWSCSLHICP